MQTRRMLRGLLLAGLAAVLAACGTRTAAPKFTTERAARMDVEQHTTASGTLSAVVSVDVGSQVSGKISALHVDFNSPVRKGQPVAEIDATVYEAARAQAEGELASAAANVTLKRATLQRKQTLISARATSQAELDLAQAELRQAEAALAIRQAALRSAIANVNYCHITSPVDGIVIARKVDLGQTVIASMNTPVLFTIAQDITHMNIKAAISEGDIGRIREGQDVSFTVDAFPEETFHGQVTQVRRAPTTTQNVVTYDTIITVDNPERKLFPGMTAEVSILVASRKGVVTVPNTALRYTPPADVRFEGEPPAQYGRMQRLVYRPGSSPGTLRAVLVRTGVSDGRRTEIIEGLREGDEVVTSTVEAGTAGARLRLGGASGSTG